jgi:hypothetical protein
MANTLFVVVENLRQYRRSPPLEESVLHLVYESAAYNNGRHPTANGVDFIRKTYRLHRFDAAGDAGRSTASPTLHKLV